MGVFSYICRTAKVGGGLTSSGLYLKCGMGCGGYTCRTAKVGGLCGSYVVRTIIDMWGDVWGLHL